MLFTFDYLFNIVDLLVALAALGVAIFVATTCPRQRGGALWLLAGGFLLRAVAGLIGQLPGLLHLQISGSSEGLSLLALYSGRLGGLCMVLALALLKSPVPAASAEGVHHV